MSVIVLGFFQQHHQFLTRHVVLHALAVGYNFFQQVADAVFHFQIAGQHRPHVLAHHDGHALGHIGLALQEQGARDQHPRVRQLVLAFMVDALEQLVQTEVLVHLGVDEILVRGG